MEHTNTTLVSNVFDGSINSIYKSPTGTFTNYQLSPNSNLPLNLNYLLRKYLDMILITVILIHGRVEVATIVQTMIEITLLHMSY